MDTLQPLWLDVLSVPAQVVYGRVGNDVAMPKLQHAGEQVVLALGKTMLPPVPSCCCRSENNGSGDRSGTFGYGMLVPALVTSQRVVHYHTDQDE
ncbi:MAG: hypothetical protein Q4A16_05080 [Lautropia sp.]|nr:hypothetical protein [Lautropia sp.]